MGKVSQVDRACPVSLEIGFVPASPAGFAAINWVRLGSFWVWGAITGEKWGSDWVCLGSFGFVLGSFFPFDQVSIFQ